MDRIVFELNDRDFIKAHLNSQRQINIKQQKLHEILRYMSQDLEYSDRITDNKSYVIFENVPKKWMDTITYYEKEYDKKAHESIKIVNSKAPSEQIEKPIYTPDKPQNIHQNNNQKFQHKPNNKHKKKKVNRTNRFVRNTVILTAATLGILSFVIKNNDNNETIDLSEPIAYEQTVDPTPIIEIPDEEIKDTPINNDEYKYYESFCLNVRENTESEKYEHCVQAYGPIIEKYAEIYGIDPVLATAIFTHERGYHSEVIDPKGGLGLCQIQVSVWNNQDVTAYNYELGEYETYHIEEEKIKDLEQNIKAGVMIIQSMLRENGYNVLQSVQAYNYGTGYMNDVLNEYQKYNNVSSEELSSQTNTDWMFYRDIISNGDPEYIENVFQYIPNGTDLTIRRPNGEDINLHYQTIRQEMTFG